ncbi:MAG TPA: LysM peptidoglycan-binding domain-containing protein, partial [Anaerolineales bacterium]|nr:LysM peptidoglycan-binding domain-containing protein [Anaerolineales bacterium]
MQNEFKEDAPTPSGKPTSQRAGGTSNGPSLFTRLINSLVNMGLGEPLIKLGVNLFSVVAIVLVVFMSRSFYRQAQDMPVAPNQDSGPDIEAAPAESLAVLDIPVTDGINRAAQLHTTIPSRPRNEVSTYVVQDGDTVFGIAEKFGLKPQTILWGNYNTLLDDPHSLKPGQELTILPVDGVYWEWLGGIPFGEWAKFYGVNAADIIEYPGNNIDPTTVGDYENANIKAG